jgi:4-amino-4-deoxy-L-arabinose transferase-like glycosyltransferase
MKTAIRVLALAYFVALSSTFALITPVGRGFDEDHHLDYVSYVARTGAIPNQYIEDESIEYEGHQPPLYYFLAAACLRLLGASDAAANFHFLRFMSVLLATFNLALVFRMSAWFPLNGFWQLAPGLLVATLPQFGFVSGMVSNDSLANLLATAAICSLLAIHAEPLRWAEYLRFGCWLGLGILTKKTIMFLIPGAAIVVGYALWQVHGKQGRILLRALGAMAVCVILSGWWFVRNHQLYGEWLGTTMEARSMHFIFYPKPLWSPYFIGRFSDVRLARLLFFETLVAFPALVPFCVGVLIVFVAGLLDRLYAWHANRRPLMPAGIVIAAPAFVFIALSLCFVCGWYSSGDFFWQLYLSAFCHLASYDLELPFGLYLAYGCVLLASLIGLVQYMWRERLRDMRTVLAVTWVSMCFAGIVYYNTMYNQAQGRFLFPVLSLIAVLVALGLQTLLTNRQRWVQTASVTAIVGIAMLGEGVAVAMAYAHYAAS